MKYALILLIAVFGSTGAIAQKPAKVKKIETCTLDVAGVCGDCKRRIEKAALVKGVKIATWDKKAQKLKVVYQTAKVNEQQIAEAVANAGHDAAGVAATDESYSSLPACCRYRDKSIEIH